jgi:hypothetical protein
MLLTAAATASVGSVPRMAPAGSGADRYGTTALHCRLILVNRLERVVVRDASRVIAWCRAKSQRTPIRERRTAKRF